MRLRRRCAPALVSLAALCLLVGAFPLPGFARVSWVEITERVPFAAGMAFGTAGPYEKIKGRLHYAVSPDNPFNRQIVDLPLAKTGQLRQDVSEVRPGRVEERVGGDARNAKAEVEFWGDFLLLKPVDLTKGNHRLLVEVTNRGRILGLNFHNDAELTNDPTSAADAGNGWLMRQGYSLLWTGWNWDVEAPGANPLRIFLPILVNPDGSPFIEKINAELTVQVKDGVQVEWLAWGGSRCYPVADDPVLQQAATLTERERPDVDAIGPRQVIPRAAWQFAVLQGGQPGFDPVHIYYPNGFAKGKLYEGLYWAKNPRVVGLGLASIRDATSFFHYEAQDDRGAANPLAVNGKADPQYAYLFGISQSGRVITTMLYQGFHVDEQGRMVFEGARPEVPGGGKGAVNYRWAQTTHHPKHIEANAYPADHFPFNFTKDGMEQVDPFRTRDGQDALAITHPNVRLYAINGSQHGAPTQVATRITPANEHAGAYIDQRPIGRALLVALDRWVTAGVEPPPSTVPQVAKGELLTATEHKQRFPQIPAYTRGDVVFPAVRHPGAALKPPRVDYGPRFFMPTVRPWDTVLVAYPGIQDYVPPQYFGPPYETRVPAFDADGNGIGGIRPLELLVPLGTYQGWNPRCAGCGAADFVQPFDTSFWPFALTEEERAATHDPRPSVAARYANKAAYVEKVKTAAAGLRQQGFMIEEGERAAVALAERMAWPPMPLNGYPFWKLEP